MNNAIVRLRPASPSLGQKMQEYRELVSLYRLAFNAVGREIPGLSQSQHIAIAQTIFQEASYFRKDYPNDYPHIVAGLIESFRLAMEVAQSLPIEQTSVAIAMWKMVEMIDL